MAAGYLTFYLTILVLRMRSEIAERKIRVMRLNQAAEAGMTARAAE
jgi:hypothetical protein